MGSGSSVEDKGAITFSSFHSSRWSTRSADTGASERHRSQSEEEVVQYAEILHDDGSEAAKKWKVC